MRSEFMLRGCVGLRLVGRLLLAVLLLLSQAAMATPYFPNLKGRPVRDLVLGPPVANPGVLLIVVDTFRPDHLGMYGYPVATSPFMDSLAAQGVVFANHFSNSSWTKPSLASIFTGLFPRRHNVLPVTSRLANDIPTLAQAFKEAGYRTGAVFSNHFGGRRYALDRGYDRFAEPSTHFGGRNPDAKELLSLATRWINEDKGKPFFYTLLLFDPHDPYYPPTGYQRIFCPGCTPPSILTPLREYHGRGPTAKQVLDMKSLYNGEVRYMDDQLKLFFGGLQKMGILDRTNVVIVGDHGEAFGEHKVFEHAFHMWDEVVRTPLVIHSPRLPARGAYVGLTQHADIFPTLLKLAGVEPRYPVQGLPLVQHQGEAGLPPIRHVVSDVQMYGISRVTIRDHEYKLVYHAPLDETDFRHYYPDPRIYPSVVLGKEKYELYHVLTDPSERKDVIATDRPRVRKLENMRERYMLTGGLEEETPPPTPTEEVIKDLRSLGYIQ